MSYLVVGLLALGVFAALLGVLSHNKEGQSGVILPDNSSCATCNGSNSKCEQECMMEAATRQIEYFDDEELDAFARRPAAEYSDEEAEQFREVLYTMKPEEVKDWARSLTLRGIEVPDQVKDELFMLIEDQ